MCAFGTGGSDICRGCYGCLIESIPILNGRMRWKRAVVTIFCRGRLVRARPWRRGVSPCEKIICNK